MIYKVVEMEDKTHAMHSLALTPTWSVASVLTVFVAISLLLERSIHRLSNWLDQSHRKPLLQTLEKMKEELMLLGFVSILLTTMSSTISTICFPSKFFGGPFLPCAKSDVHEEVEENTSEGRKLLPFAPPAFRRLMSFHRNKCPEGKEPFVSYDGLEQLHRFIFIMAVTHIAYSCLTMLLAIVKVHSWRKWEDKAQMDRRDSLTEITTELVLRRQTSYAKKQESNCFTRSNFWIWVKCFFRQFSHSVLRSDYLTLRKGFIMKHKLTRRYDFHTYMIRSMEDEFQRIVVVSGPLWGFVVAFMLFHIKGSNLYFWIAILPVLLVLSVGTKLQHVMATLTLESAGISGFFTGTKLKPRDDLFWFKKPGLLLGLIHFILFQNSFELASFFWFWWQFGYDSCFIKNHLLLYVRIILGFAGQFLCSYSTLPLYALVTQMGTNYKAALIPQRIRETIQGWKKTASKRKNRLGIYGDDSTVFTDTSTMLSMYDVDDHNDNQLVDIPESVIPTHSEIELQSPPTADASPPVANETSSRVGTPLLRPYASISSRLPTSPLTKEVARCYSMPT